MTILAGVFAARRRLLGRVRRTPLVRSAWLSGLTGADVHLKLESLQPGHSFKIRGAFNALLARMERGEVPDHLVTASAGNHGRAMAIAARTLGLGLTVFTPRDAPATKLTAIRALGADLHATAADYDEAERMAKDWARHGGAFVSPYSDPDVIAGAGTIALEILEDLPEVSVVLAPVGGGGLIAGLGLAARAASSGIEVLGAEVESSPAFTTALAAGRVVPVEVRPTLADGLAGNLDPDTITFALVQRLVHRVESVGEADLVAAIRGLLCEEHLVAEGAGATGVAALLAGRVSGKGRPIAVVISGANIDASRLAGILAHFDTSSSVPRPA
jgi:threonine dehydratase